jgi:hypothetical protein
MEIANEILFFLRKALWLTGTRPGEIGKLKPNGSLKPVRIVTARRATSCISRLDSTWGYPAVSRNNTKRLREKMNPELKEADIQPVKKKREPRILLFWEGGEG